MKPIDFLPDRIKHQRRRRVRLRRQGTMLGLCAAMLAALAWSNQGRVADARADLAVVEGRRQAVQEQLAIIPQLLDLQEQEQIKLQIAREMGTRVDLPALMAELTRLLPPEASLSALDCSLVEARTSSPPAIRGTITQAGGAAPQTRVALVLTGLAPSDVDVVNFLGALSTSPLFEDVTMGYSRSTVIGQDRRKARSFQVSCLLAR